jgi:uncharacterized protein with HEPN domain
MQHEPLAWLSDVRDAADHIAAFIQDRTFADYETDPMFRSAVERQPEIVGEALNQFSKEAPDIAARLPNLRAAVAMRNILIHGYRSIEREIAGERSRAAYPNYAPRSPLPSTNWATHRNRP